MFGQVKRKILVLSAISVLLAACNSNEKSLSSFEIKGETQGTTYSIIVVDENIDVEKREIDSIFSAFDKALSTYEPNSVISKLNDATDSLTIEDHTNFFQRCYALSRVIYTKTHGCFDPSVFPLVKGWGFMNDMNSPLNQVQVDSILNFVSFEENKLHSITFDHAAIHLQKKSPSFKLDFNAVAQGLSVDVIDAFLKNKGYTNYYIEIGGELIVRGHNRDGEKWRIGVDSPKENLTTRELENVLSISNKAVATSGNYRKFYEVDGQKYAHTLNPKTGFPVRHSLLSATVVANDAGSADAYATAFMVMGIDKTLQFVADHPDLELDVYLLYADQQGEIQRKMSSNFQKYLN